MPFWWLPSKTQNHDCGLQGPTSPDSTLLSKVTLSVEHLGGDVCISLRPFRKQMTSGHLSTGERTCVSDRVPYQAAAAAPSHSLFSGDRSPSPIHTQGGGMRSTPWEELCLHTSFVVLQGIFAPPRLFVFNHYLISVWTPGYLFYSFGITQDFIKILLLQFYQLWSLEALSKLFLPILVGLSIFSYTPFARQTYCKYILPVYGLSFFFHFLSDVFDQQKFWILIYSNLLTYSRFF